MPNRCFKSLVPKWLNATNPNRPTPNVPWHKEIHMDKLELVRDSISRGSFDDLPLSTFDSPSLKPGGPNHSRGSSPDPEFFPSKNSCSSQTEDPADQPPPQPSEGGQPQQSQEQPQKEEELDIGKVIASLAPGGGD
jgi:hypothetical protein